MWRFIKYDFCHQKRKFADFSSKLSSSSKSSGSSPAEPSCVRFKVTHLLWTLFPLKEAETPEYIHTSTRVNPSSRSGNTPCPRAETDRTRADRVSPAACFQGLERSLGAVGPALPARCALQERVTVSETNFPFSVSEQQLRFPK